MKVIFAGTPEFALPALKALLNSKHEICAVYTKPDCPAGRGLRLTASPVKQMALAANLTVVQPLSLKDYAALEQLKGFAADVLVDVACGLLLPKEVLTIPRLGCVNIHPSLLPRWRGAAPMQRAILAGDAMTGLTIMQMDVGLDTGAIFRQESILLGPQDTTATVEPRLAELGAKMLLSVLEELENGIAKAIPQDDTQTCYAAKITKEEAMIDWHKSAIEIDRMVCAFNPWPIAFTQIGEFIVRVFKALPLTEAQNIEVVGTIIKSNKEGIDVITGDGVLRLLEIQLPGGKVLPVGEVLKARKEMFSVGKKFTLINN
ncbi:MAG: methionyl-tRNA formyltransferase [Gammaproteobacteria bacterium GWE2_37_16]|nr:MAG: methionyl-tRNA formyltransferase [Gammaproteobacteria bacterium GWE2_37_16]